MGTAGTKLSPAEIKAKCEETAARWPGWHVFSSPNGLPCAVRESLPLPDDAPPGASPSLIANFMAADLWANLEAQLAAEPQLQAEAHP